MTTNPEPELDTDVRQTRPGDVAIITDPDKAPGHQAIAMRTVTTDGWSWVTAEGDRYAINAVNILRLLRVDFIENWFAVGDDVARVAISGEDMAVEADADDMRAAAKLEAAEDRLEALSKAAEVLNPDVGGGLRFTRSPERARDMLAIEAAKWVLHG